MTNRVGDLAFVPEDAPEGDDFEPLPKGFYGFEIVECEVASNKKGDGRNLRLKYQQVDGGRTIQEWFSVDNPSEVAQNIARGKLAKLSRIVGLPGIPAKSEKLIGKKLDLKLDIETWTAADGKTGTQNVIKGHDEFKGATKVAAKAVAKQVNQEPESAIPFDEDDIPF